MAAENQPSQDWITKIIERERQYHKAFFGQEFDLADFKKKLREHGRKKVKFWQSLGLEPHFLPQVSMMAGDDYPGWKIKPEQWFFKMLVEGKFLCKTGNSLEKIASAGLSGVTVLIDTRLKPAYANGKQMWENDNLFGPIMKKLRKEGKIPAYNNGSQDSRFGTSADEIESHIKKAFAEKIDLRETRLESVMEANVISQIYSDLPRKDDGKTDTSVWYEEFLDGCGLRLIGGHSDFGGLAYVRCYGSGDHWYYGSFRLLAVL